MTKLKAMFRALFHLTRHDSARSNTGAVRFHSGSGLDALLIEDHTPEHERGDW